MLTITFPVSEAKLTWPYPEIVPLSALIACNAMNWPGGDALSFSYRFHHWLMLYTLGQYIVIVQSSTTSDGFSTIVIFGIWEQKHRWVLSQTVLFDLGQYSIDLWDSIVMRLDLYCLLYFLLTYFWLQSFVAWPNHCQIITNRFYILLVTHVFMPFTIKICNWHK